MILVVVVLVFVGACSNVKPPHPAMIKEWAKEYAPGKRLQVDEVRFHPNGKSAVVIWNDSTVAIWSIPDGKELQVFRTGPVQTGSMSKHPSGLACSASFSQDGRSLLVGYSNTSTRLWDVETGRVIREYGTWEWQGPVLFSPDNRRIAQNRSCDAIVILDSKTGEEVQTLIAEGIHDMDFSPDGQRLVAGIDMPFANTRPEEPRHCPIRVFNIGTGKHQEFWGHEKGVWAVKFLQDGRRIISGSLDRAARLWDVNTGKELRRFVGHRNGIADIAVSRDGRLLATAAGWNEEGSLRIWEIETGKELARWRAGSLCTVAFSPDGRYVLTGGNYLRLWDLSKVIGVGAVPAPRPGGGSEAGRKAKDDAADGNK